MRAPLLALLVLTACGGRPSTALEWGSRQLECPRDEIDVTYIDIDTFEVVGCGQHVLYFCPSRNACERIGGDEGNGAAGAEPAAAFEGEETGSALSAPTPASAGKGSGFTSIDSRR